MSTPNDLLTFLRTRSMPKRLIRVGLALTSTIYSLRPDTLLAKSSRTSHEPHGGWLGEGGPAPLELPVAPARSRGELFFIDAGVADPGAFWLAAPKDATVVCIPAGADSWAFMAEQAEKLHGLGAIHLVSHGEAGALILNERRYTAADLDARIAHLQRLGRALTKNGDILLYGCGTGAGAEGQKFLNTLSAATGADIAASNDVTGNARNGGNWELEIVTGTIDAIGSLNKTLLTDYAHTLATITVTSNADSGAGTLRQAIAAADPGDTIAFNAGMTITLTSGQLTLSKNLIIDGDLDNNGTADVTVDANYSSRVFSISSGSIVTLEGLTITHGSVSGNGGNGGDLNSGGTTASDGANAMGAGIYNAGTLTLRNSTVTANGAGGGGGGGGVAGLYVGGAGGGSGPLHNGGSTGIGGTGGSAGPNTGEYAGVAGSIGSGGRGGGDSSNAGYMGGRGGTSTGGAGGIGNFSSSDYSNGGAGATATSGALSIGGGGGGSGWDATGRAGGSASGGIYNAATGTIFVVGTSTIANNLGAGGGGGGGSGVGGYAYTNFNGGAAGRGVGGIWNAGTLNITAANFAAMTGNDGASGSGGLEGQGGITGSVPTAQDNIHNGGSLNTAYVDNTTPAIANLNTDSVAWAGVGNAVTLDSGGNASLTDTELGALNSGNGDWSGANLAVQRSGTAITADTLGFNLSGALFTVSGSNLQSGGLTFATFTNTGGVLTISFTSSGTAATTALVNDVARRITYRNDTPSGDATVRFTLSDGTASTTADVTVTSNTIYVTNTTDTATKDASDGVSFSEAVAIAGDDATGSQTIVFSSSLAATALSINGVSLTESLAFDLDTASGVSLTGGTITLSAATTQTFTHGTGDTATIASAITGSGALTKTGAGTLTLSNTNTYTGATTISAGTLTVTGGDAISTNSSVSVASGATFSLLSNETIGNLSGAGSVNLGIRTLNTWLTADSTFSGIISGSGLGGLTVNQSGAATYALTLSGNNTYTGPTWLQSFAWLKLDGPGAVPSSSQLRFYSNSKVTLLSDQTVGSLTGTSGATLDLGAFTLSAGGDNNFTTVSGAISGSGNLVKQGSGTLTLDSVNTYSGTTTVSAGTLSVASDSNLGSNSLTLAAGATLDVTGATTIDNAIALSGDATVSNSANATLSGIISGANTLTKAGASTLTLSGSNTYTGTTVSAGTLSVASDANLGSGAVSLASGSTLAISGATNIDNAITLTGNATVSTTANATLSGIISGANTLTKSGASALILSGTNTYAGTTVSAGTLSVASDANLGSGSITLAAGAILQVTNATTIDNAIALSGNATVNISANATLSGVISGGFNLAKSGSSTLTLSGTNTYNNTTVSAGTLSVSSDSNLGSGGITLAAGTTLAITGATNIDNAVTLSGAATINTSADATLSGNIGGAGSLVKTGSNALTLSGTNSYAGSTTVSAGTLLVAGDGNLGSSTITQATGSTLTITGASTVDNAIALSGNTTINASNALTLSGTISGAGGITKTGAGTLTLTGANGFTGNVAVSAGGLTLSGGAAIDNSAAVTMSSGSTLTLSSSETIGSLAGTGTIALGANTLTTGGDNTSTSFAGNIGGTGGGLTKAGAGTFTLSGTNTYTGATTISAGAVDAQNGAAIGDSSAVSVASGAFLVLSASESIGSLAGAGSVSLGANTLTTGGNNTSTTFSGDLNGNGGLTKSGSGTLTLSNAGNSGSMSGDITVSGGTLSVASDNHLSSGTVTLAGGSTLDVTGATTIDNAIALSGSATINNSANATFSGVISGASLTKAGASTLTLTNSNSYSSTTLSAGTLSVASDGNLGSGSITLAAGTTFSITGATTIDNAIALTGNATVSNSADATLSGAVSGSFNLAKTGASTLTLSNTNTYGGTTTVSAGTLSVASDANLGSDTLALASGTTLAITGATNIDNAIALSGGTASVNNSTDATLSGNITGAGSLTKAGTSTLTLSGTNSYTGATNVNAGILLVNGALSATSNTTVASAATLGGSGSIASDVTVDSGGTLSPGNSPGTMTIDGNLTMASGSTFVVEIAGATAGTGYDQLIVNGTVDVSGATLSVTHGYTAGSGDTYAIIVNDAADAVTGTFSGLSEGATVTAGGNSTVLTASYIGATGNDITLTAPVMPYVTNVSALEANGTYNIGDTVTVAVGFSEQIFLSTGTIQLTLETGTTDRVLSYVAGSGSTTLYFNYTVQEGDISSDLDYVGTSGLAANGDTIQGATFINAILTLPTPGAAGSIAANKAIVIDGIRPTAGIVITDTALAAGETSTVTVTFSDAVTGLDLGDFTVANGILSSPTTGDGGITWTATLTPTAGTSDASNLITLANTGVADAAGNTGTGTTDSNNFAIDTLRPTAGIVVTDASLTQGETTLVTITFNEAVTGLTNAGLTIPNGALTTVATSDGGITWTATFTPTASVTDATNVITLDNTSVQDAAGNTGTGTTDSNNFAIDNVVPGAPSAPDLAQASDSGSSDTDNITNVTTPTFTGTAEAGSTVELFRGGSTSLGTTTADGSGNWSLTVGTALAEGSYSITARTTDAVGQTGPASAALSVTIDTTVPAIPVITTITDDTGDSATDLITSDNTLTLSGTGAANETVTVFRNAAQIGTATADGLGAWNFDYTATTLAAGTHTFTATTTDLAGNASPASAAFLVEIDTDTPSAPLIVALSNDTGASTTDGITSDNTLLFAGTADANVTVTLSQSGTGVIGTTTANGTGVWSFDYSSTTLADGMYLFTAFASDTAGNTSAVSADFPVTIDTTAPSITTQPAGGTYIAGGSFTLTVAATDATTLVYQWYLGAAALSDSSNRTGSTTASVTHTSIGTIGFNGGYTVQLTDFAGNTTTSSAAVIVVNKADQTITFPVIADRLTTDASFAVIATSDTAFPITYSVISGPATISGTTVTVTGAGTVIIRAAQAGDINHNPASVDRTFAVTKATAPVVLGGLAQTYDGTTKNASATTTPSGLPVSITYEGSATAPVNAGSYAVVATVDDPIYQGTASGTLVVSATNQSLTFTPVGTIAVNTPVTLTATAGSGLPVTFSLLSGNATLSGATLTALDATPITLRATQSGNGNYNAVTADQTVTNITKIAQTITFATPADRPFAAPAFSLGATASSSLPVAYTVSGPATIAGDVVTLTGVPGVVTITAQQAGDAVYAAASDVIRSFTVLADYPAPAPDGFAASVTGGAGTGSQAVTVTTAADFRTHAESTDLKVITVVGILNLGTTPVAVRSNKTIQGADANAALVGCLLLPTGSNNIVIRGLNLTNPATSLAGLTDINNAVTLAGARGVFITHCSFFDAANHALKIWTGSDNVTVSWSEFYNTLGAVTTGSGIVIGGTTETAPIRVSLHHNLWSAGIVQNMPAATYGHVHLYNNVFNASGNTTGTEALDQSQLLSERNVYTGVASPLTRRHVNTALPIGRILAIDNTYTGTTGTAPYAELDQVFTPSYSYEALPVSDVVAVVSANVGNNAGANDTDDTTGTATITGPGAPVTPGTAFALNAVATGFTPATYQWRRNNVAIPGATFATYNVGSALEIDAAVYTAAIVMSTGDMVVSRPLTITLNAAPVTPADMQLKVDGGGSPSAWFFSALAILSGLRALRARKKERT